MNKRTIQKHRAYKYKETFLEKSLGVPVEYTWDVDYTFAKLMLPILKMFKKVDNCYPGNLTQEEWENIIQQIVDGLELILDDSIDLKETIEEAIVREKAKEKKIQESLYLFAKWCRSMWW